MREASGSLLRSRFLGCHVTGGALRDIPKNGCGGDYWTSSKAKRLVGQARNYDNFKDMPGQQCKRKSSFP